MTYQGKARNGHGPAPMVKAYQGTACNHVGERRITRAHLRAVALGLCSLLYLAVR